MKQKIVEIINNNSIQVNRHKDVIYGCDFENLASQLDDLFALRGVVGSLQTRKYQTFYGWLNTYFEMFGTMRYQNILNQRIYEKADLRKLYDEYYIKL